MNILCGNVSKAAETRLVNGSKGKKTLVTDFSVAENLGYGENKRTKFWKVTIWGDRGANLAPHLVKGREVYVVGEADADPYISREGNAARELTITRVQELKLLGKKPTAEVEEIFEGDEIEE